MQRFAAVLLLLAASLAPAHAGERISRFVSDVHVQRNGDLDVVETIAVVAEGQIIKRGILRDFPTSYSNKDGTKVEVGFDLLGVSRDGKVEPYSVERLSNGYRVRIGSADHMLATGAHTYVIRYRATRQIGFFSDFDELYWNATGTGWTLPIEVAEARIRLPENVGFMKSAFYTGVQGAKDKDAEVVMQGSDTIVFRTTKPLSPRNGLTVAAGWQKGVVEAPSDGRRAGYWLVDNLPLATTAFGLVLLLGYYAFAWRNVGRDPQAGVIVPLFGPPKGMSPAGVRYVARMGMDDKTFTAGMIELGVQGHIKLVEAKTGTMNVVPRGDGKPLAAPEKAIMTSLFGKRKSPLALDPENHGILKRAQKALRAQLEQSYSGKLFQDHKAWSWRGMIASLGVIFIVLFSTFAAWGGDLGVTILVGQLSLVPAVILLSALLIAGRPRSAPAWGFTIFGCVFSLVVGLGGYHLIADNFGWVNVVPASVPLLVMPIASSAFSWMKAHTLEGRRITDEIEGFRQYLGVAEEDRLNLLNPPEKTPELFEKFLPYAVALDVENAWASRFAELLAQMPEPIANDWYSDRKDRNDNPATFANYLGSALNNAIASASTPPGSSGSDSSSSSSSSSGSDGGGSSGGGGGGGGGDGW